MPTELPTMDAGLQMGTGPRPSHAQRRAVGRAARSIVARPEQAQWQRKPDGPPALEQLRAQESIRVPALLPLRYERMAMSPWSYFRGAATVMAADLAGHAHTGLMVQMCGDAHILNFGLWATPERNLAFALRDFDETLTGPFEWDVKRLATSIVVIARENGRPDEVALDAVRTCVGAYRKRMRRYATAGQLEVWYDAIHVEELVGYFPREARDTARRHIAKKARKRTSQGAFDRLVEHVDGRLRIREEPPRTTHLPEPVHVDIAHQIYEQYRQTLLPDRQVCLDKFTHLDTVRQVVGVGSVGMQVYLVLLSGPRDEPLFLQVKQAGPSVYEKHLGPSPYANHAERVINGKRLIQSASDMFAGWTRFAGADFYVRQFRDMKVIPDGNLLQPILADFASACGAALAKAHARSGDPTAIDAYLGRNPAFTTAMTVFAASYADRNEADHADLDAALRRSSR